MEALLLLTSMLSQAAESLGESATHMAAGTVQFTDMLVRYDTLMITGAAWSLIQAGRKGMPRAADHAYSQRIMPFASIILCTIFAFFPYWRLGTWDETLIYGIVIGGSLGQGHKILSQSVFGKDRRINPYVDDPELRKVIDEYVAAKESGDAKAKKTVMQHFKDLMT